LLLPANLGECRRIEGWVGEFELIEVNVESLVSANERVRSGVMAGVTVIGGGTEIEIMRLVVTVDRATIGPDHEAGDLGDSASSSI